MRKEAQERLEHVYCEGCTETDRIANVWIFKYLGSRFCANGEQTADVKARIAMATTTAGKMRNIWASKSIPLRHKLCLYKTGVCSKLTYGSEAWRLDGRT